MDYIWFVQVTKGLDTGYPDVVILMNVLRIHITVQMKPTVRTPLAGSLVNVKLDTMETDINVQVNRLIIILSHGVIIMVLSYEGQSVIFHLQLLPLPTC